MIPSLCDYGYPSNEERDGHLCDGNVLLMLDANLHPSSVFPYQGGETAGLAHLNSYIWEKELVKSYKQTRNSLVGPDNSTKFSAWSVFSDESSEVLLTVFQVVQRIVVPSENLLRSETIRNRTGTKGRRLLDRVRIALARFFQIHRYEIRQPIVLWTRPSTRTLRLETGSDSIRSVEKYVRSIDRCTLSRTSPSAGNTGVPFVDANMREILNTGWMSNRGRQNVASNLTKDFGIDWRYGAVWFESILVSVFSCAFEKVRSSCSSGWSWCLLELWQLGLCSRSGEWPTRESTFQHDQASFWLWSWGEIPARRALPSSIIHLLSGCVCSYLVSRTGAITEWIHSYAMAGTRSCVKRRWGRTWR